MHPIMCVMRLVMTLAICLSVVAVAETTTSKSSTSSPTFVSVCGDPAMLQPEPRILLEGWNFCNRCGRSCSTAPRWADCIAKNGTQLVSEEANAAGLSENQQNQSNCDAFTEQKERHLGSLCAQKNELGLKTYFWTAMLKSGAMNISERGHLCGLWCNKKDPSCNPGLLYQGLLVSPVGEDTNYSMRQPRVKHVWSKPDGSGGYSGSFYGTYDSSADMSSLPTPDTVIQNTMSGAKCSLSGTWLGGNGDRSLPIVIKQIMGESVFNASCAYTPTPGQPSPWYNQSGRVGGDGTVKLHLQGHTDRGSYTHVWPVANGSCGDVLCWSQTSFWCRNNGVGECASDAAKMCSTSPKQNISSYFGMEWFVREGRKIFRQVIRSGWDLSWIMLYVGPEAAEGGKGGYPWDGRGIYNPVPMSTVFNTTVKNFTSGLTNEKNEIPHNNFKVRAWYNISKWPGGPGFYFLNMGACWKDNGSQCDGDISTDVTRYLLFQLPSPHASLNDPNRCGQLPQQKIHCPPNHTYRNGTMVHLGDPLFPYRAYHSVPVTLKDSGFRCKHDCWSNPCDQDWIRIEPSPEWGEYGFPASVEEAMTPKKYEMDVGAVTGIMSQHFAGVAPPVMYWPTLNMGPEMVGAPGTMAVWELAELDVLVQKN